jgi:hypothetical protein
MPAPPFASGREKDEPRAHRTGPWSDAWISALSARGNNNARDLGIRSVDQHLPTLWHLEYVIPTLLVRALDSAGYGGVAAQIAASVQEAAFDYLDGPVLRVCAPHSPVPQSPVLLEVYVPDSAKVEAAVRSLSARG